MSIAVIRRALSPIQAEFSLPGDKSISHRRALFSLLVDEPVDLRNYGTGDDCSTTLECLKSLGKQVERAGNSVVVTGGETPDSACLNCGNSGTTARLLFGLLAGRRGKWQLTGDASLSRRPMERVAHPLRRMGARISLNDGCLPAFIEGASLHGIEYESPVASAQVKSAVLLAGLSATGDTQYKEPIQTRDHTERLLKIERNSDGWIKLNSTSSKTGAHHLSGTIPGDPSTATFWVLAAMLIPGSRIILRNMLANPLRIEHLDTLNQFGASISLAQESEVGGERIATVEVRDSFVRSFHVSPELAPSLIDEVPALAVLASQLDGVSEFCGVGELRVKESDRLDLVCNGLSAMGAKVHSWSDGFSVRGPCVLKGVRIRTGGDHRIAMSFAIAGLIAQGITEIEDSESVAVSYPEFWSELSRVAPRTITIHE